MMDSWPEEHGQGYKTALQACTGQLTTPEQVEAARQAFLAATEEAALVVVGAEPAVKATRRPAGDCQAQKPGADGGSGRFVDPLPGARNGHQRNAGPRPHNTVGTDRSSLLREGRILKAQHRAATLPAQTQ